MPWLKSSDRFATHPLVLAIRRAVGADSRSTNEVVGWLHRAATYSANHLTDYEVPFEALELFGGSRTDKLIAQACDAGLLKRRGRGRNRTFHLIRDDDLWHIILREDRAWNLQRDKDRRTPDLTMPVRARDGDVCRYCGVVVTSTKDTRSGRALTLHHVHPGQPATFDTYVVACVGCNSKLGDQPHPVEGMPLRPPPPLPYFSPAMPTRNLLKEWFGYEIPSANEPPAGTHAGVYDGRHGQRSSTTPADGPGSPQRPQAAPHETPHPATSSDGRGTAQRPHGTPRTATPWDTATSQGGPQTERSGQEPPPLRPPSWAEPDRGEAPPPDPPHESGPGARWSEPGTGLAGSGRDGAGQVGPGGSPAVPGEISAHSPEDQPPSSEPRSNVDPTKARRRRGRRGKRGGGGS